MGNDIDSAFQKALLNNNRKLSFHSRTPFFFFLKKGFLGPYFQPERDWVLKHEV